MTGDGLGAIRGCASALLITAAAAAVIVLIVRAFGAAAPASSVIARVPESASALARCRAMGEGALGDPQCQRVWRTVREAFLARR